MRTKYTREHRATVVQLVVEDGLSLAEAARRVGTTGMTAKRWVDRYLDTGSLDLMPQGGGALRKLDEDDVEALLRWAEEEPELSMRELTDKLLSERGKQLSPQTTAIYMSEAGWVRRKPDQIGHSDGNRDTGTRYRPHHRGEPDGRRYPSSLTDREWDLLQPLVAELDTGWGRPPKHDRREMLDAMFYVVRSGCSWRWLPAHYPPWQTVYAAFRTWNDRGWFQQVCDTLRESWREHIGRDVEPSAGIADSQTVKTTEKGGSAATTVERR